MTFADVATALLIVGVAALCARLAKASLESRKAHDSTTSQPRSVSASTCCDRLLIVSGDKAYVYEPATDRLVPREPHELVM